jgi:maleate isomerase
MDLARFASAPALGLLVPPANPTVEPEMNRLIASGARVYATRLPVMPDTTLEQRNRAYIASYEPALKTFGSLKLDAATVALTGPSYRFGAPEDDSLAARLTLSAGFPVETASGAIRHALAALGAKRICLFSPYPAWLTDEAAGYWTGAGFEVGQVVKVSETFRAYELTTAEVEAALAQVETTGIDAIVMSGTGMITLPAMLARPEHAGPPLLSSNLCCAWWMMKVAGVSPGEVFVRACPQLAATLA